MLKYSLLAILAFCAFSGFCAGVAQVGQPLPSELAPTDENGAAHPLALYKGKTGVVIFFFPKAFTGGCVCENRGFSDYAEKYMKKGYTVIGASRDIPETLVKFKSIYKLNYTMLSDPNDELSRALGLVPGQRDSIVIDKNGIVIKQEHNVDAPTHHKTLINEIAKQ
ncbi:MAG TPA: peroxiredoxin [Planctomycetota bacterium]|nr:peroxiredoxin [Planctomycetota bacterium]